MNLDKELILWLKANKIKKFKSADIELEFSDLAFIDELNQPVTEKEMPFGNHSTLQDTEKPLSREEEDDLLFWSAK